MTLLLSISLGYTGSSKAILKKEEEKKDLRKNLLS